MSESTEETREHTEQFTVENSLTQGKKEVFMQGQMKKAKQRNETIQILVPHRNTDLLKRMEISRIAKILESKKHL